MIRWKYVIPRLVVLVIAVLLLAFAVNPLVRWSVMRSGSRLIGASVEVGSVRTSYQRSIVELTDFQAADPRQPMKNLFEAKQVQLQLDPAALSRRKFVVERGVVSGMKLGTDRKTSGALSEEERERSGLALGEKFSEYGEQWLDQAGELLESDLEQNFESVKLARELSERWPNEYAQLTLEATQAKERIARLRHFLEDAGENPLRNIESYQQAISDLDAMRRQLFEVRGRVDRLGQQLQMDKAAIAKAKQHDEALVRERLELVEMDPQQLSEYFLGPELGQRMATVVHWLQWGRERLPKSAGDKADVMRGEEILFPGMKPLPDLLVKTLVLNGEGTFGGERVTMEGVVKRLTSDPKLLDEPTEVTVQTVEGPTMLVHAVLDSRGDIGHDEVVIDMPQLRMPQKVLGRPEQLALSVAPGRAHVWMKVQMSGADLTGEMVIQQQSPKLTAVLPPQQVQFANLINDATADIDLLEARISLNGTLHAPRWKLNSNLGPQLAGALQQAVTSEVYAKRDALLREANHEVDATLAKIEATFAKQQQWAINELRLGDAEIDQVKQSIASRVGLPDGLLDKKSPLREIFRR